MVEKEYTVCVNNLKISGSAEAIHKLSGVYGLAACSYGETIIEETKGEHRDNVISELIECRRKLEETEKQLVDAIKDSDYYKKFSAEMTAMIDEVLQEVEARG